MPSISEYCDAFKKEFPNSEITPGHLMLFEWYAGKSHSEERAFSVVWTLRKFKPFIDLAKTHHPTTDLTLMRIYHYLDHSMEMEPTEHAVTLAHRMYHWVKAWEELNNQSVDKDQLHIFCYIAIEQPELSTSQVLNRLEFIYREISVFIERRRLSSIDMIPLYLWAARKYSFLEVKNLVDRISIINPSDLEKEILKVFPESYLLELEEVMDWLDKVNPSDLKKKISKIFPVSYLFSNIEFEWSPNGKAKLHVSTRTYFSYPNLVDSVKEFFDKNKDKKNTLSASFDLKRGDTQESVLEKMQLYFRTLEATISTEVREERKLFENCRNKCMGAAKAYANYYRNGFPGRNYFESIWSRDEKLPEKNAKINGLTREDVRNLNDTQLQKKLAAGLDPNFYWDRDSDSWPILNSIVHTSFNYDITTIPWTPTKDDLKILCRDDIVNSGPPVILACENDVYSLYWSEDRENIQGPIKIQDKKQVRVLLGCSRLFKESSVNNVKYHKHMGKLLKLIGAYLDVYFEQQHKQKAQAIERRMALLIAYGADPGMRYESGATTVEQIITNSYEYPQGDSPYGDMGYTYDHPKRPAYKKLLKNLLRLTLRSDRGRSHLEYIHSSYDDHFLGKIIIGYQQSLVNGDKIPPSLQAIECIQRHRIPRMKITNAKKASVYLESIPLDTLDQFPQAKQDIMDLCKKTFLKDVKMSEEELKKYVEKKLEPTHEQSVIDLLYNEEGKVVAFNIADIVPPKNPGESVMHFIRLAVTDKSIRDDFKKLTSIIHYQRLLYLMALYQAVVLTAFTAASALSYILVSDLMIYPKYQCMSVSDILRLYNAFFKGRDMFVENGRCYFESDLFYIAKPRVESVGNPEILPGISDMDRNIYNELFEKNRCSTLVAFWSTPENINRLSKKINPELQDLTFEKAAKKADFLNAYSLCRRKASY